MGRTWRELNGEKAYRHDHVYCACIKLSKVKKMNKTKTVFILCSLFLS